MVCRPPPWAPPPSRKAGRLYLWAPSENVGRFLARSVSFWVKDIVSERYTLQRKVNTSLLGFGNSDGNVNVFLFLPCSILDEEKVCKGCKGEMRGGPINGMKAHAPRLSKDL